jgi:hypothetical protein
MKGMSSLQNVMQQGSQAISVTVPFDSAEEGAMRARLEALRDVAIVLSLQIVFRATMLLRRLNY